MTTTLIHHKLEPGMDLTAPEFARNAHTWLARMRDDAPVYEGRSFRGKTAYLLTKYADCEQFFRDERLTKKPDNSGGNRDDAIWMPKAFRAMMDNMLNTDNPEHQRLRSLVHKAFTPRRIADLEPRIEAIANTVIDRAIQEKQVDLIESFALPLPIQVIAEMIGIPDEDQHKFAGWAEAMIFDSSPVAMAKSMVSIWSFMRYTRKLAEKRRADPQDDLMTALVQAEADNEVFTEEELMAMIYLLVLGGHETTVGLITNGTYALLQHPEQLDLLRSDMSLLPTAIEELLRYDGPLITGETNYASENITLRGTTIPQGAMVYLAILSANRDTGAFDNADMLDITRTPNKHLAFGKGIHYCLGAPLARLEADIAFRMLLERVPELRLAVPAADLRYKNAVPVHQLETLPVMLK